MDVLEATAIDECGDMNASAIFVEARTEGERACADRVAALLLAGTELRRDARRPCIYDLQDGDDAYWLYMSEPGRALLLGCRHPNGGH